VLVGLNVCLNRRCRNIARSTTTNHFNVLTEKNQLPRLGPMNHVSYITSIAIDNISGGFSAMNRAMFDSLSFKYSIDYVGPVNPQPSFSQHCLSKALRVVRLGGDFYFFSEKRLEFIRSIVEKRLAVSPALFAVFHGFTPWILIRPSMPYTAWCDCTFWQYIHIYHDAGRFRSSDLQRIKESEAAWLRNAERVIFRSEWAASQAIADYQLNPDRVGVVGNYGFMKPPSRDLYEKGQDFLMITTNFLQKGGPLTVEAFRQVHINHPATRLVIAGDYPGEKVLREPGVVYLGWIDKSNADQTALLRTAVARARCLVHPTTADTNPMVLIEAGYFGCPSISSKRFAIPELVKDGASGMLLEDPTDVTAIAGAMLWMLEQDERYFRMRQEARNHMLRHYTVEVFQQRLATEFETIEKGLKIQTSISH
jgi:glycosyltransferase involved in cell wall biosynthesis